MSIKDLNQVPPVIGAEQATPVGGVEIVYIPVDRIFPHPDNPRKDLGDLTELAESIKARGIMQNLTVVPREEDTYTAVIGHRRLAASKLAGISHVPCVISGMDEREQLATMITENAQRADLTAYEQAQAFGQLSMDFGMSAADISKQTGFSESTVRRRLKMAEMSPDALKKAFDKGKQITMADMERLAEIDDVKERESVLGYIGTQNFEYHLSCALREQKTAKAKAEWTEIMADMDIPRLPADQKYSGKWEKVGTFALAKKPDRDWVYGLRDDGKLVDGGEVRYIFDTYPDALLIYKEKLLTKEEQAAEEERADHRREYEVRGEAVKRIRAAFDQVAELRKAFIADYPEASAKAKLGVIARHAVKWLTGDGELGIVMDSVLGYIGDFEDDGDMPAILAQVDKRPCHNLLALVYGAMERDATQAYPCRMYDYRGDKKYTMGEYDQDEDYGTLADVYEFLGALGYEMSDVERALMDGTSELYYHEGYELPAEGDEDTDEDAAEDALSVTAASGSDTSPCGGGSGDEKEEPDVRPMSRLEAYRTMSDEELEKELNGDEYEDSSMDHLKCAIREGKDAAKIAEIVEDWYCPEHVGCEDTSRYCKDCIAEWLNAPYRKEASNE